MSLEFELLRIVVCSMSNNLFYPDRGTRANATGYQSVHPSGRGNAVG